MPAPTRRAFLRAPCAPSDGEGYAVGYAAGSRYFLNHSFKDIEHEKHKIKTYGKAEFGASFGLVCR